MNRFLSSTALALALSLSAGAFAQTASSPGAITQQQSGEYLADDVIGASVRNAQNETIGSVSDLVIDHEGKVKAAVVSVGGFLGIGDKHVALPWSDVKLQTETRGAAPGTATSGSADTSRDPVLLVNATKDQLKQAPEFKTLAQQQREMNRSAPPSTGTAPAPRTTPVQ
jgi:sporulation protein YlmC with PRC-barrel domain